MALPVRICARTRFIRPVLPVQLLQPCVSTRIPPIHARSSRCFSGSPILAKKQKSNSPKARDAPEAPAARTPQEDAFDFSGLSSQISKCMERLTTELTELKSGGKFNPKVLESLEVSIDKSGLEKKKLREMAQLVTKGRYINIILYDQAHVKAVKSAIQRSDLSVNPQGPAADAPTTLTAQIPPPTAESRAAAQGDAKRAHQKAVERVQDARAAKHKKLQELKTSKALRDDDFRKAHKEMEEVAQKGAREAKRLWDDAKKAIESG